MRAFFNARTSTHIKRQIHAKPHKMHAKPRTFYAKHNYVRFEYSTILTTSHTRKTTRVFVDSSCRESAAQNRKGIKTNDTRFSTYVILSVMFSVKHCVSQTAQNFQRFGRHKKRGFPKFSDARFFVPLQLS